MLTAHTTASGDAPSQSSHVFWADLRDPTSTEIAQVTADFGIPIPSRESLQEIEASSRLRASGRVLFASMPLATEDETHVYAPVPLGFIISPQILITVRYCDVHAFAQVEAAIDTGPQVGSSVFCARIDGMVDFCADRLERLSSRLGSLSAQAFAPQGSGRQLERGASGVLRDSLKAVGTAGDQLSHFR